MATRLIDAEPTSYSQIKEGVHFIQFGEMEVWHRFGAVILTEAEPRYVRFMVTLGETGLPAFVEEAERPLTPEEVAHFTKLAKEEERKARKELHQQQRRTVEQRPQGLELMDSALSGGRNTT